MCTSIHDHFKESTGQPLFKEKVHPLMGEQRKDIIIMGVIEIPGAQEWPIFFLHAIRMHLT